MFSKEEINVAIERVKSKKTAPGPDGITNKIIAVIHSIEPCLLRDVFNKCIRSETFPNVWKKSKVVLLKKGNKPNDLPSSYRPLCLINDLGKILEFLISKRLEEAARTNSGIARNQFGFRKGMSTDDAVRKLNNIINETVNNYEYCAAIGIDIKNAFNSLR